MLIIDKSLVIQTEVHLIVVAGGVAVGVSLAVLVLHAVGHIGILGVAGHVVGADADAIRVDSQNLIALGQSQRQLADRGKAAEDDVQRSGRIGVSAMPGMRLAPTSVVSLWVSAVGLPLSSTLQTVLSSQMSSSR